MIIDSSHTPTPPLNGLVQLTISREGHYEELDLDFETVTMWEHRYWFKCYDTAGNILMIKMVPHIVEEAIFGDVVYEPGSPASPPAPDHGPDTVPG